MYKFFMIASVLAVLGLTSCEKGLDYGTINAGSEQVTNSLLQVRTRTGGSGSEATISYPLQVYVFQGDDCRVAAAPVVTQAAVTAIIQAKEINV